MTLKQLLDRIEAAAREAKEASSALKALEASDLRSRDFYAFAQAHASLSDQIAAALQTQVQARKDVHDALQRDSRGAAA